MAHQVHWTKLILEAFIDKAMLSDQEKFIIESRVMGKITIVNVAHTAQGRSTNTVHMLEKYSLLRYT